MRPDPFAAEIRRLVMARCRKLEDQAQVFLKMGYTVDELMVVERRFPCLPHLDDVGVYPKSIAGLPAPSRSG